MSLSKAEQAIVQKMNEKHLRKLVKKVSTTQSEKHSTKKVVEVGRLEGAYVTVDKVAPSTLSQADDVAMLREMKG